MHRESYRDETWTCPGQASQSREMRMAHLVLGACITAAVANPGAFRTDRLPNGSST